LAVVVFLDVNGYTVTLDDDEAFDLVMRAAAGELDVEEIPGCVGRPSPT
jgi:prophage maintenance system killer protein